MLLIMKTMATDFDIELLIFTEKKNLKKTKPKPQAILTNVMISESTKIC